MCYINMLPLKRGGFNSFKPSRLYRTEPKWFLQEHVRDLFKKVQIAEVKAVESCVLYMHACSFHSCIT